VVVFPADKAYWLRGSRRAQFVRPSTDGRWVMRGLPPGDYLLATVPDMDATDLGDTAFLDQLAPNSTRFTLAEGEKKVLGAL
jgi:hypothetical protein